jgi:hypothetical protein
MNLEWFKQHKLATGVIVVAGLIVLYVVSKKSSSSSSGLAGIVAGEQQGQLQMAQLNAQLSASSNQTSAQLEAEQIAANAQTQHEQDQLVSSILGTQLVYGNQSKVLEEEINARQNELTTLAPEIQGLITDIPHEKGHNLVQQSEVNALALLLGETNPNILPGAGGLPSVTQSGPSSSFGINIPGLGSVGVSGF